MLNDRGVRRSLVYPKRTSLKLIAAVLGVLATGVPMVLFNVWLKNQGDNEISAMSAWALASAEARISQAIKALDGLAAQGVDACRPAHIEAMRRAAMLSGPVKEMMLVTPNGQQTLCTDTGVLVGRRQVLGSMVVTRLGVALEAIELAGRGERFLRIRKLATTDKPVLAALVPASLLMPHTSVQGVSPLGHARIRLANGTLLGETGAATNLGSEQEPRFQHRMESQRYPFFITVASMRGGAIASYDDLRRIGMVASGLLAMVILLFALIFPWQHAANPVADITKAILAEEFVPYYQPVVDIQTGRLLGAEVVVRWRRPDGSLVEPAAFVPLMESSGLVLDLTRSLMRKVRNDLGGQLSRRPAMTIAFNIAPQHFDDALVLNDVGTIFGGSPIKLSQIVLELTERYEVANLTSMRRTIAALQGLGCKVAIDDVGTGHSGLSYILKLGVDIIKIDKIFVEAIGTEGHSKAIIETLIDLAANMRMELIAEGVETFDQVSYLRERGIRAAQGYVFAPPLPASSFVKLLEAMDPVAGVPAQAASGKVAAGRASALSRASA